MLPVATVKKAAAAGGAVKPIHASKLRKGIARILIMGSMAGPASGASAGNANIAKLM